MNCDSEVYKLARRGGSPYSDGHRAMYDAPATLLRNKPASILDVGCGIGYGYEVLRQHKCVASYTGIDVDAQCVEHCRTHHPTGTFIHSGLVDFAGPIVEPFDFVFCVEVFEHVPADERTGFLMTLFDMTRKNLFISTPNAATHSHGVVTPRSMVRWLRDVGFDVAAVDHQWTCLYVCGGIPL